LALLTETRIGILILPSPVASVPGKRRYQDIRGVHRICHSDCMDKRRKDSCTIRFGLCPSSRFCCPKTELGGKRLSSGGWKNTFYELCHTVFTSLIFRTTVYFPKILRRRLPNSKHLADKTRNHRETVIHPAIIALAPFPPMSQLRSGGDRPV
jgi:hypothetical protein